MTAAPGLHDELLREGRPSLLWLLAEWRALAEAAALGWQWPLLAQAPRGDGHPVLVLPGLLAGDGSTWLLRRFLRQRGFQAQAWREGRNLGPREGLLPRLQQRLLALHEQSGQRVSLVGWSLGGLYARELARLQPQTVRQVISLGSPLYGHPRRNTRSWWTYRLASGRAAQAHPRRDGAPPVPTTSVFSRGDGVVSWRACVERPGPMVQNIETFGSHLGYGVNGLVLWLLADRLAQPEQRWSRFAPPPWLAPFFRLHD
jgi:pimeloyl-ACP methyl ester carboxylesterase